MKELLQMQILHTFLLVEVGFNLGKACSREREREKGCVEMVMEFYLSQNEKKKERERIVYLVGGCI